jgi:acetyl esterase/lipase
MQSNIASLGHGLSRRTVLGGAAALTATPALANECRIGPPPHDRGPIVFNGMDQVELDAAYDQIFYSPLQGQIIKRAPVTVTYGTNETPEFQRQSRDFAAAVKAAGKPVELIVAPDYNHFEIAESLGNPYGPNGRAALALMKLA